MRTAYQSDRATLLVGDAREALPDLATESVDLVITDPPYGVEWRSGLRAEAFALLANDSAGDRDGIHTILAECVRTVGQNRHLYVFGPTDVLEGLKIGRPVGLTWDKGINGAGDLAGPWAPSTEPITFAVTKHTHPGQIGQDSIPARMRKGSIIRAVRPTGRNVRHPTEKPIALLAELIESSSRAGELVLDPCAGVGSTGVAAILRGRRTLLIELDDGYADIARRRLIRAEELADQAAAA